MTDARKRGDHKRGGAHCAIGACVDDSTEPIGFVLLLGCVAYERELSISVGCKQDRAGGSVTRAAGCGFESVRVGASPLCGARVHRHVRAGMRRWVMWFARGTAKDGCIVIGCC